MKGFSDDDAPKSPRDAKNSHQQSLEGAHWFSSPRKRPDYKSISLLKERRGIPARAKTPLQYQLPSTLSSSVPLGAEDIFRGADEEYELKMDLDDVPTARDAAPSRKMKEESKSAAKAPAELSQSGALKKKTVKSAVPDLHPHHDEGNSYSTL